MSMFGFTTSGSGGGDFLPIVKFDARAGRFFRVDRTNAGDGFESDPVDITDTFKAIFDFDNLEVGWLMFVAGAAPNMVLVPMRDLQAGEVKKPERPSENHKEGFRFMLKLAKECGGDTPIREIAGTANVFKAGIQAAYMAYEAGRDANPGKLPVFTVEKITPIKSGSGARSSTNYQPTFRLSGWVARGDLKPVERTAVAPSEATKLLKTIGNGSPPSTGSNVSERPAPVPAKPAAQPVLLDDDFG